MTSNTFAEISKNTTTFFQGLKRNKHIENLIRSEMREKISREKFSTSLIQDSLWNICFLNWKQLFYEMYQEKLQCCTIAWIYRFNQNKPSEYLTADRSCITKILVKILVEVCIPRLYASFDTFFRPNWSFLGGRVSL